MTCKCQDVLAAPGLHPGTPEPVTGNVDCSGSQGGKQVKLLLIDSDRHLIEMLTGWLKTLGYDVHHAYNGERAKRMWLEEQPDLVIVDTAISDVDALALCRDLQSKHDALVMVMTDGKDVQDEVYCLESGADDYLRKPFFPNQLLAHIHAISHRARSTLQQRPSSIITVGPIRVDSLHNEVSVRGMTYRLTPTESKLLHLLAINANDVCTAGQIVAYIWGYNGDGDASLIKAHIRHLRQKIEPDPSTPRFICTVPGVGYTLIRHPAEEIDAKPLTHAHAL
jgi:DNA-binding response OmpR family regulator